MNFRKISLFDASTFAKWRKDSTLGWQVGWAINPKKWGLKEEKDWIVRSLRDKSYEFWACLLGEKVIGRVGIYNIDFEKKSGEISILFGEEKYRNKGFGEQALNFILEKAQKELELTRIYATIFEDNKGAMKFFERNGFEKSGESGTMNFLGKKRKFLFFEYTQ